MSGPLSFLALIASPLVLSLLLALVQLAIYRLLARMGWLGQRPVPMFLILVLRSLIVVVMIAAVLAIIQNLSSGRSS